MPPLDTLFPAELPVPSVGMPPPTKNTTPAHVARWNEDSEGGRDHTLAAYEVLLGAVSGWFR